MLSLRVLGIRVEIHFSHLLFAGLIAWIASGVKGPVAWPSHILANASHPDRPVVLGAVVACWMLIITASMLAQELAQALVLRASGASPVVYLLGLGGLIRAPDAAQLPWWKRFLAVLAGPAAGLAVGIASSLVALLGGSALPDPVRYFATIAGFGNLAWTAVTLMPISPLPGGQLAALLLTRLFGRQGFLLAQLLALGVAGLLLLGALLARQPFLAVLVALMVLRTVANLAAWRRGELPVPEAAHPLQGLLESAEALYRDRKYDEARRLAARLVDDPQPPPLLRSRAHLLLGWIALKESQGRRALDHFSQVQGLFVPPHALAAGFSLLGDEHRAIPLWAEAVKTAPQNELLVHEYAGALIRGGREAEARLVPGAKLARAFTHAERVSYVRGDYEQAARAAEGAFKEEPSAAHAYTAACNWARAGQVAPALRYLALASQHGYRDATGARTDPDLSALRGRPEFEGWLAGLGQTSPS